MPYSDAVLYFHGSSGTLGSPLTDTVNALTGVSQSGTTLTYTVATGQVTVGQVIILAGGAPTVSASVTVTAILTGSGLTGTATVNPSQTVTSTTGTAYPDTKGDAVGASGSQYSNLELDFGAPSSGVAYPWVPGFPSLTEKGYTFPPEHPGSGGTDFGVHIIITAPFNNANGFTGLTFDVCTASHTAALYTDSPNPIASRVLSLAQLSILGASYFIPVPQSAVLEFLRWYAVVGTGDPTTGAIVSYWGPRLS